MRIRRLLRAAVAMLTVGVGLAGPLLGSSIGHAAVAPRVGTGSRLKSAPNLVFAGYVVNRVASRLAITTTLVVPKLDCTGTNRAIAAGTGMSISGTDSAAELFVGCVNGKPRYFPVLSVHGARTGFKRLAVHQGDRVELKAAGGRRGVTVTVFDESRKGIRRSLRGAGANRVGDPWVGDMAWSNRSSSERVPNFGMLGYSGSKLGGKPLGGYAKLQRFDRVSTAGKLQIKTGPLTGDRESFQTFFKHA